MEEKCFAGGERTFKQPLWLINASQILGNVYYYLSTIEVKQIR